jgi:DNA-binding transcriptional LysR family regulator
MPVLDVSRLRVLRAVVASGTVQAAANHLGYTPSAISQQLAALQRETGLTLFEKSGRGIAPTAIGLLLAERSNEVMDSLGRLDGLVDDLREGRTGNLTIGTISSAGQWWIPSVAKALTEQFPEVLLSVDLNEAPMASAANYDIDIRTEDPTEPPTQVVGYRRHELAEEPYLLLVPADHPLACRTSVAASELAGERWIDDQPGQNSCRVIRDAAWRSAGFMPRYIARAADTHAAITFVGAGVGIAVLPRLAIGTPPPTVAVLDIDDPQPRRRIVMHIREGGEANPAIACAVRTLRQVSAAS